MPLRCLSQGRSAPWIHLISAEDMAAHTKVFTLLSGGASWQIISGQPGANKLDKHFNQKWKAKSPIPRLSKKGPKMSLGVGLKWGT